jgi:hypothetical protein
MTFVVFIGAMVPGNFGDFSVGYLLFVVPAEAGTY